MKSSFPPSTSASCAFTLQPTTPRPINPLLPSTMSNSASFRSSLALPNAPTGPKRTSFADTMGHRSRLQPPQIPWRPAPSPSAQRQSSSPLVHSPLQQSIPLGADMSKSEPNSPKSMTQETPARRSRLSEQATRPRGESRSSSVPLVVREPQHSEDENEGSGHHSLTSNSRPNSGATSPLPSPGENQSGQDRRSVKHLTCFWWWEKGECKHSDEECREFPLIRS